MPSGEIRYAWRGPFTDDEVNTLHAAAFGNAEPGNAPMWERVNRHSLGWVTARRADDLVGFVNVAWDGGLHAVLLDTAVSPTVQRGGIGTRLVATAADGARSAGCAWLHVDFEPHLRRFYLDLCGFRPTHAGLIALRS
ncbi:MAG TPA: GNAT family N-acetyltransferase [Thermomicrobiales bacterium]|jgi:GNAT superfamily N-acetyltransferase|nr:GNAT family N-acetyltransferase [Thermomicrobiales bacterium]